MPASFPEAKIAFSQMPPLDAAPTWDYTHSGKLQGWRIKRGRQKSLGRFEAGSAIVTLDNRGRHFDPAHNPAIKLMQRVRLEALRGIQYPRFDGLIRRIEQHYDDFNNAYATIHLVDLKHLLRQKPLETPYKSTVLTYGPQGYWPLQEELSTEPITELSGLAANGSYVGTPTMRQPDAISDDLDGAVSFAAGQNADLGTEAAVVGSGPFTALIWIYVPAGGPIDQRVFEQVGAWGMFMDGTNAKIGGFLQPAGSSFSRTVATNAWHLVGLKREAADPARIGIGIDGGAFSFSGTGGVLSYTAGLLRVATNPVIAGHPAIWHRELTDAEFAAIYNAASAYLNDYTGERIQRVLNLVGIPSSMQDVELPGNTQLQSANDINGKSAVEHIDKVEETEEGYFFIGAAGAATFFGRRLLSYTPYSTPALILGDQAGELPYKGIEPYLDEGDYYTQVRVTPRGAATQIASAVPDGESPRTLKRDAQLMRTVTEAKDKAYGLLEIHKIPRETVPKIEIEPHAANDSDLWDPVLDADLLTPVEIRRTPPGGGARKIISAHVQGIEEEMGISNGDIKWEVRWDLLRREAVAMWVLGTSELGLETNLAW